MRRTRITVLAAMLVVSGAAAAQTGTGNVNDCTLIQDPVELRNCILKYGNVRTQPPGMIEAAPPALPAQAAPSSDLDAEIIEVPTPGPGRSNAAVKRSDKPSGPKRPLATLQPAPQAAPLPRPNPKDTIVHIEQIDLSKVSR